MKLRYLVPFLLFVTPVPVSAHEAPEGWSYDPWCCGGHDCGPVVGYEYTHPTDGSLAMMIITVRTLEGKLVKGKVTANLDGVKVEASKDGAMHACIYPPETDHIRCLYMPPGNQGENPKWYREGSVKPWHMRVGSTPTSPTKGLRK